MQVSSCDTSCCVRRTDIPVGDSFTFKINMVNDFSITMPPGSAARILIACLHKRKTAIRKDKKRDKILLTCSTIRS